MPYSSKSQQRLAGSTGYESSESTLTSTSAPELSSMPYDTTKITGGRISTPSKKTASIKGGRVGPTKGGSGSITGGRIGGGMAKGK